MGEAVDVVRQFHDRFNDRDLEGVIGLCSRRIVWREVKEIPGAGVYQGPEEMRDWYEKTAEVSDDLTLQVWEMEERGDAALAETSAEMTGRGSEVAMGWRFWAVWRVREGLVTYHHAYSEREDALADLESSAGGPSGGTPEP
jgi:ketosteroid isomerase-like protein